MQPTTRWTIAMLALTACAPEQAPGGAIGAWEGERRTGTFVVDGEAVELDYEQIGDEMIFENDIVLHPADQLAGEGDIGTASAALFAVASDARLWPNGVVPYVIDDSITTPNRVRNAMAIWAQTGVRFVPRSGQRSYVVFRERDQSVCSANVGYREGAVSYVNLRDTTRWRSCPLGIVVHEIGHVLGFWHEQTRPERDEHVRVLWRNIPDHHHDQFEIRSVGRRLGPYDIDSTMHYLSSFLTNGDGPSIVRLDGSRINHDYETLSRGDIAGIRALYFGGTEAAADAPALEPDDGPPEDVVIDDSDLSEELEPVTASDAALPAIELEDVSPPAPPTGCSAAPTARSSAVGLLALALLALVHRMRRAR